jgi:hypothetical protein
MPAIKNWLRVCKRRHRHHLSLPLIHHNALEARRRPPVLPLGSLMKEPDVLDTVTTRHLLLSSTAVTNILALL